LAGKSGADPEKVVEVVKEIREKCSRLHFAGLMTIGRFDEHPEPDFRVSLLRAQLPPALASVPVACVVCVVCDVCDVCGVCGAVDR
jgi:hypothetical protein